MNEKPILFSTSMVKAILEGRKTQTRRVAPTFIQNDDPLWEDRDGDLHEKLEARRYSVGDRLWVRETHYTTPDKKELLGYVADGDYPHDKTYRIRPSIFMFRKFSRITLEVTGVKVERLQDISEDDAIAEGTPINDIIGVNAARIAGLTTVDYYALLWDSINGKTYPWKSNPWVFAYTFKALKEGK